MSRSLPLIYLLSHGGAIALFPRQAELLSFLFLIAAPLLAAASCLWRFRRCDATAPSLALAMGLLLWTSGMVVNMVESVFLSNTATTPGLSILLYALYGVPLTYALASRIRESLPLRILDGVLAAVLGYLLFVLTSSFATLGSAYEPGLGNLLLLFDVENGFIALFSLARYLASGTPARRSFYRAQTTFAFTYMAAAIYINRLEPQYGGFGSYSDLIVDLPFLLLASLAWYTPKRNANPAVSPRLVTVVLAVSPLMLPMSLLVVAALIAASHLHIAIAGFVIATLGYGVRSVVVQLRAADERAQLDALARVDKLTGLANRREFDDALLREWKRARRSGEPLALLMVDIDHFKPLNDALGHQAGDARLRDVARALASGTSRALDVVARYGGEEFAVILPATQGTAAQALAEQMRAAVAALALPAPTGHITVSIGVSAVQTPTSDDPAPLLMATDAALYDAKRAGRNCVAWRALDQANHWQARPLGTSQDGHDAEP